MELIHHRPAAPLDSYVQRMWWSNRSRSQSAREYMLPGGTAQLIFALHETPIVCLPGSIGAVAVSWRKGVVHGPQWRHYITGPKPQGAVLGVSFRPGAAGAVLGLPIAEITNCHVPIDSLWGAHGLRLHERLLAAGTPEAAFRMLEQELVARLTNSTVMHPAVAHALAFGQERWAAARIADVQRQSGYSPRHFIALFRAGVGLTPKHYQRVQRFKTVVERLATGHGGNLADVAALAGYSDQSHLAREFRDIAGIAPTHYRPRSPDSALHHLAPGPVDRPAGGR